MKSCAEFRSLFRTGTDDPALLEHVRLCDPCLDHAAHVDPDVMFRALGGDIAPPGGVDAFVAGVMHAVQLRTAEESLAPVVTFDWARKLGYAAVLAVGITGATLVYHDGSAPARQPDVAAVQKNIGVTTTKPVVETYSSANATIVEVPAEAAADTRIVMVIDDSLPVNL